VYEHSSLEQTLAANLDRLLLCYCQEGYALHFKSVKL
jgi:hypothetical protein